MPNIEKVIKGLEFCQIGCGNDCPYWTRPLGSTSICRSEMERDALALLKAQGEEIEELKQEIEGHKDNLRETLDEMMRYANELKSQEPRVMTLEEVITSKPGTVVWLEDFDKPDVISGLLKRLFIHTKVIDFLIVEEEVNNEVTADLDVYGSGWRCWTSRPDEKRRAETPWN